MNRSTELSSVITKFLYVKDITQ